MKHNSSKTAFIFIVLGVVLGFFIKLFVLDILFISGNSMEPALHNNSRVAVNKLKYGLVKPFSANFIKQWSTPQIQDIVIYLHDNKIVVKRCVAISGQLLEFSEDSEYSVKVNGKVIPLTEIQYKKMSQFSCVPEGYILALGDNLSESIDSRDYGFVSVKNITGKVIGK